MVGKEYKSRPRVRARVEGHIWGLSLSKIDKGRRGEKELKGLVHLCSCLTLADKTREIGYYGTPVKLEISGFMACWVLSLGARGRLTSEPTLVAYAL